MIADKLYRRLDDMFAKKKQAIEISQVSNNIEIVSHCNFTNWKIEFLILDRNAIVASLKLLQNNNND